MDHDTFSAIAHRDLRYLNPVGEATMESLFGLLRPAPGARVVDLGCGKGEALVRLTELHGVRAVGVDRNPRFIEAALQRARAVVPDGGLELRVCDVSEFRAASASFDVALCVGATHLFGGLAGAARELARLVVPGGSALVGEGFWRGPTPEPAYLEFLGASAKDLESHEGNRRVLAEAGWDVLHSVVASDDEWEAYEETYLAGVERHALDHPGDPEVPAMLERVRAWNRMYRTHGRYHLGFGLYLLRRR